MIDDDERREVAARLRGLDAHEWYNAADEVDALETAIGCCIGQDWQDQNWWHRLADLIETEPERTCRIVPHGHLVTLSDGTELHESACSECGAYLCDEDNYCSICGARVIGNE